MGRFFALARQLPGCINLSLGEPDFPVPKTALHAGWKAAKEGKTRYEPTNGLPELREALAEKAYRDYGIRYDPESEVLITVGATEAISIALLALLNPGDEVLISDPGFVAYEPCVVLSEGVPVSIPLREENNFKPSVRDVTSLLTPESRVMLLNFPNNPTGSILSHEEAIHLAKIAAERDMIVISDEVYEKIVYEETKHECMAAFPRMRERTLVVGSFSKTYAMTGLRVGYVYGPKELISPLWALHQYLVACVDSIAQHIGLAALTGPQQSVGKMVKELGRRRNLVYERLNKIEGVRCTLPGGAFYAFPNIRSFNVSSQQFSKFLLKEAQVITVPGSMFGCLGEGYIRLSYTTAYSKLEEALDRIERALKKLKHN
jgi:aminotransferase